jgi:hypothetical protein
VVPHSTRGGRDRRRASAATEHASGSASSAHTRRAVMRA